MGKNTKNKVTTSVMLREFPLELAESLKNHYETRTTTQAVENACRDIVLLQNELDEAQNDMRILRDNFNEVRQCLKMKRDSDIRLDALLTDSV